MVNAQMEFTSADIANVKYTIVGNVLPNSTYTLVVGNIHHLTDTDEYSALEYDRFLIYNGSTYTNSSFTTTINTPSDNVSVNMELVLSSANIVTATYSNFSYANYKNYAYTFDISAYPNKLRTTPLLTKTISFDTSRINTSDSINIVDVDTTPRYFKMHNFRNKTVDGGQVRTNLGGSLLEFNVYDVGGLAYMRAYAYSTDIGQDFSNIHNALHNSLDASQLQTNIRLSADGNRMLLVTCNLSTQNAYMFTFVNNTWSWLNKNDRTGSYSTLYRYPISHRRTYTANALTKKGDKLIMCVGSNVQIYNYGGTWNTIIIFDKPVHCITISGDGNTILASANNATGSSNTNLSGPGGGKAKVYALEGTTWVNKGDLSSDKIPSFSAYMFYGSDSALSGDGKTAVVWGCKNSTNPSGFIWKFNNLTSLWVHVYTLITPINFTSNHYTPCAISHDGKVIVVCSFDANKCLIYETSNYLEWGDPYIQSGPLNNPINDCDISYDGYTVLLCCKKLTIQVLKKNPTWQLYSRTLNSKINSNEDIVTCAISYDASTICVSTMTEISTIRLEKDVTISDVLNYMKPSSSIFKFVDYNNIPKPTWNTTWSKYDIDTLKKGSGHSDAMSLSWDGSKMLVGIPENNKSRLYENLSSPVIYKEFEGGFKCSMDDLGIWIVTSDAFGTLRVHNSETTSVFHISISLTSNPINLKMSKDGTTFVLTPIDDKTIFYKVKTTSSWTAYTVTTYNTPSVNTKRTKLHSVDLNYDGSIVVCAGFGGGEFDKDTDGGYISVFSTTTATYKYINTMSGLYVGQSVAISSHKNPDTNQYVIIVGIPLAYNLVTSLKFGAVIHLTYDDTTMVLGFIKTSHLSFTSYSPRLGRSVAIDARGYRGLISGNNEHYDQDTDRDAEIITDGGIQYLTLHGPEDIYIPSVFADNQYGLFTAKGYLLSGAGYSENFQGIGHQCKMSSDGRTVAFSGGGYVRVLRIA